MNTVVLDNCTDATIIFKTEEQSKNVNVITNASCLNCLTKFTVSNGNTLTHAIQMNTSQEKAQQFMTGLDKSCNPVTQPILRIGKQGYIMNQSDAKRLQENQQKKAKALQIPETKE